jgi:hypothetical protein
MRLAVGEQTSDTRASLKKRKERIPVRISAVAVARDVLLKEGIAGLFRGSVLTCAAGVVGSGLYIGCYEGSKLYLFNA